VATFCVALIPPLRVAPTGREPPFDALEAARGLDAADLFEGP
jgi:hypothetical protein